MTTIAPIQDAVTQRMARFEVSGRLGRGGFATVERAFDRVRRQDVALKSLLPHLADDPEMRRRFVAEANLLASLQHPNLVAAHDVGQIDGIPFFTMELLDGRTLAQSLPLGLTLPPEEAARVMAGICAAVEYLHQHGLVHRDITASNVMLTRDGRVVLMDLGIARSVSEATTARSGLLGTPECIAPEQVAGQPAGQAADIYALGILCYRLLCGRPPFSGETSHVLHAHVFDQPPALRLMRPGLPERVYEAVEAALAKDPARRPARATILASVLQPDSALPAPPRRREIAPETTEHAAPRIRPRRTRRRLWHRIGAAAVLAALGAVMWFWPGGGGGETAREASVTSLRVYDNVFTANEGAFVPGDSVAACLELRAGGRSDPLTLVVTEGNAVPGLTAGSRIVGRSAPVLPQDGPTCLPVSLVARGLSPGDYRLWVLQGAKALASARFMALPSS